MNTEHLIDIFPEKKEEIFQRWKEKDVWNIQDILLLTFGYEYKGVLWDFILEGDNIFPVRQYWTAIEATNEKKPKKFLNYVSKTTEPSGWIICKVKKRTFLAWAETRWPDEPRVQKMCKLYHAYDLKNGGTGLSTQKNQAIIKNAGDNVQIEMFKEHCKNNPPESFEFNKTELIKDLMERKNLPKLSLASYRSYVKVMKIEELIAAANNT